MKDAGPMDWKSLPMPGTKTCIDLDLRFSFEELDLIKHGVIPEEMEDKWFIFWEDDTLFFHRSWTGFCLYIVKFVVNDEGAKGYEAELNRKQEQYRNTDDEYDGRMIFFLINALLLRKQAPFPSKRASKGERAIEMFHLIGDASFGKHPGDDREPRFQIRSRCYLCKYKFRGHPGCRAFPKGLPHELASGDVMHWPDRPFPGDQGTRFELNPRFIGRMKPELENQLEEAGVLCRPDEID